MEDVQHDGQEAFENMPIDVVQWSRVDTFCECKM